MMMIFLGIFTGAIVMLTRVSTHHPGCRRHGERTSTARSSGSTGLCGPPLPISSPGISAASGYWYVEFMTSNTGPSVCTQLSGNTGGERARRAWTLAGTGYTGLSSWLPIASHITNGNATASSVDPPVPFILVASGGNVSQERLTVQLVAASGNPQTSSRSMVTFTAVNSQTASQAASNSATYTSSICTQVGRP